MGIKFIKSGLMMAILCHYDQDTACPDIWLNNIFSEFACKDISEWD